MSTIIDQKRLFHKIKHDLEEWREIILMVNSLLKWEKRIYPGIIFSIITFFYLMLWYLNLSTLTLISLLLLIITLTDYVFPSISKIFFKQENWTGIKENKFEEVCQEICKTRMMLYSFYNLLFTVREQKSTVFIISITLVLVVLVWIGSVVDNLLLSYITTLCIILYPGLQYHGFMNTCMKQLGAIFTSKLKLNENNKSE